MPRKSRNKRRGTAQKKPRGRLFKAFERAILGGIMSTVAFVVERQLVRALKKGGRKPEPAKQGQLFTATQQVRDEPRG